MSKSFKILFLYPNEAMSGVASSNLALLSAYLKHDGFSNVKLFDCFTYKLGDTQDQVRERLGQVKKSNIDDYVKLKEENIYEDFIKLVDEYQPDLIGTTVMDSTLELALSFFEKIKDRKIPTIVGGVGATFLHEKILNTGLVDYACIGEGEEALVELCNKVSNGEDCSQIRNIYTKGTDGKIIKNPLRPLINLDTILMPDFSIYEDMLFYRPFRGGVVRTLQFDIDRGCPYGCTYCAAPTLKTLFKDEGCGNYYRIKNWDKAFAEMKYLIEAYDLNFVWLSSETILAIPDKKFKEFAERYKREINLPLWCQSRLDTFTEEKTKLLAEMGCMSMCVGLEHGAESIRNTLLNKRMSRERILESIRYIAKNGIALSVNNMIGLPGETREDVFEGIKLNREIAAILGKLFSINAFTFMPFSGTKLRDTCIDKGYIEEDVMSTSFFKNSVLKMPTMSPEEIRGLERTLLLYVLLPESYYPDIKIAETDDEMFQKLMEIKKSII